MKAEDLMIGDWVLCDGKSYQIAEIGGMVCLDAEEELFASLEDIEPIPLTPEILEKNGFKKSESDILSQTWAWAEKSEKIYNRWVQITFYNVPINGVSYLTKIETCSSKGDGVNRLHSCDIESVHELQHCLKLVGIEKNIVL